MLIVRLMMPFATLATLVGVVRLLVWATADPLRAVRDGTATLYDLVGAAAGVGAWVVLTWVVVVLVVTALAAAPGIVGRTATRAGQRITPAATRQLARIALGLAVATGPVALAGPAVATGSAVASEQGAAAQAIEPAVAALATSALDVEPAGPAEFAELPHIDRPTRPDQVPVTVTPDRPGGTDQPSGGVVVPPTRDEPEEQTITVVHGDTLWAIAAEHLGPDATPAEIAAEWPRWYQANRRVIGDDPDLIMPGIVLQNPHQLGDNSP